MILKVLGSVSPYSHKEKNCPGYLITTDSKLLLDCGNGITRYMNFPKDLENLTIIISHLHKDHYGDLFSIAYASYVYHNLGLLSKRIKVYIPKQTSLDELYDFELLTNLGIEHYLDINTYTEEDVIDIKSTQITFSKNPHSIPSYSTKISYDNKNIVYSGDTGYLGNTLEKFAAGTNLLICESTFLKGQKRNKDYHLYAHEAALIASSSKAKKLLLTHFWPEIDKEKYLEEALPIFNNTDVAEENKVLRIN